MKNATFTNPAEQASYDRLMDFVAEYAKTDEAAVRLELIAGIMRMAASLVTIQSRRSAGASIADQAMLEVLTDGLTHAVSTR